MFFYVVFQEFKHTLSKSEKRFDLVGAILLSLIWPIIFSVAVVVFQFDGFRGLKKVIR
jgi:hypothetical protein